jgi:mitochondrial fission protein ELM1
MVSEAVSTGKPVYLWPLPGGSAKFDRFHDGLQEHGAVRWFDGSLDRWRYPRIDATERIAEEIVRRRGEARPAAAAPG